MKTTNVNNHGGLFFAIIIVCVITLTWISIDNMNYQKDLADLKTLIQNTSKIYVITIEKIGYWDYNKMIDCASRGYDAFTRDCIRKQVECEENNYCTTLIKNQEFNDFRMGRLYEGESNNEIPFNITNYSNDNSNPWIVIKIN